jgi:hypothetical protein
MLYFKPEGWGVKNPGIVSKIFVQNFLRRDSLKGFIFITASRDLRKTVTFGPLPAKQDF